MNKDEFEFLATLVKKRSGLSLTEDKVHLLENRLLPIARSRNMPTVSDLHNAIRLKPTEDLLVEVIEAMTTNESSFFRDIKPYEQLRSIILPTLMQSLAGQKRMRIWSAACSTGQEPYSVAMCIQEDVAQMPGWGFEIIATDLSSKVLNKAKQGSYSQFEVQRGMPTLMLINYFTPQPDTSWQLKNHIRTMVQFKLHNLLDNYAPLGNFDLVLLRNVLVYFDNETKAAITEKMARVLTPRGILMLGSKETLVDPKGLFMPMPQIQGGYKLKR